MLTEAGRAEGEEFVYTEAPIGGAAIDATGDPYPASTEEVCKASDAVLLACIGGCARRGGGEGPTRRATAVQLLPAQSLWLGGQYSPCAGGRGRASGGEHEV